MNLFDSHAHLDDEKFDNDRETIIDEILTEMKGFITAGYSLQASREAVKLSKNIMMFIQHVAFLPMTFHNQRTKCGKV